MCRYLLILFVSEGLLFIQLRMQVVNRRCLHPVNRDRSTGFFVPAADLLGISSSSSSSYNFSDALHMRSITYALLFRLFVTRLASIIRIGR